MTCSTSFLNNLIAALALVAGLGLSGCASAGGPQPVAVPASGEAVAVMPPENLSGAPAPMKEIWRGLMDGLKKRGVAVLGEDEVEGFMARHRVRYTGGIDRDTARLLKEETHAKAAVITSVELYSPSGPPKFAITSRLVSSGAEPEILWIDGSGAAGDDRMGFLELGLVMDPKEMMARGMSQLVDSLAAYLREGKKPAAETGDRRFRPKVFFRSPVYTPEQGYKVIVAPFFNKSERKNAGEIMMLHFIRRLMAEKGMSVAEPGVVRDGLLRLRVVMDEGLTLDTADMVLATLRADMLVTGTVLDYEDFQGQFGSPKVDFTAQAIEKKSLEVVWSAKSHNQGDDGVYFFDRGRINTANQTAAMMVDRVVGQAGRD